MLNADYLFHNFITKAKTGPCEADNIVTFEKLNSDHIVDLLCPLVVVFYTLRNIIAQRLLFKRPNNFVLFQNPPLSRNILKHDDVDRALFSILRRYLRQ